MIPRLFTESKYIAIDCETTGLNSWAGNRPFAVAMCDERGRTWFCQWKVDPYTREVEANRSDIEFIAQTLSGEREIVMHNRPFDTAMLSTVGISFSPEKCHDTAISAKIVNNLEMSYALKDLSKIYLGIDNKDEKDLLGIVRKARKRCQVYNDWVAAPNNLPLIKTGKAPQEDYWLPRYFDNDDNSLKEYAIRDVVRTIGLWVFHKEIMLRDPFLWNTYQDERACFAATDAMVARGMSISPEKIEEQLEKAKLSMDHHLKRMIAIISEKKLHPWELSLEAFPFLREELPWAFSQAKSTRTIKIKQEEAAKLDKASEEDRATFFNPRSSQQIRRVLFLPTRIGGLGLPTSKYTRMGPAIDRNTLRDLMHSEFVRELIAYRTAKQAIGLFFEKYKKLMVEEEWAGKREHVLHPVLNQSGAAPTGRFSCTNPNLQQVRNIKVGISIEAGEMYNVRAVFRPRQGYNIYAADYAQQEIRIFAALGKIPFLLQEIRAGRDPNDSCANHVWGGRNNEAGLKAAALALELGGRTPSSELVSEAWASLEWNEKASKDWGFSSQRSFEAADEWLRQHDYNIVRAESSLDKKSSRQRAKCSIFAKLYGGGPHSVTGLLHCTVDEAKEFMAEYDRAIPEIRSYMKRLIREARINGYIINPYGRKLRIDQQFVYRAVNYLIQSTAASMMKDSMRRCHSYIQESRLDAHLLITIHDELQFEIYKDHVSDWLLSDLKTIMEDNKGRLNIPMTVDMSVITESWDKKEKVYVA